MSNYHNLDNEEVLFIYFLNKTFVQRYSETLEIGGIEEFVEINENTVINTFKQLTDEALKEMLDSPHYNYCLKIDSKLGPIIELIRDSFPDLYDKVRQSFKNDKL